MRFPLPFLLAVFLQITTVFAAFGYTEDDDYYTIDSGANLVIKVNKCCGDITSLVYKDVEYQGYDGKNTQVESGLGSSTVSISQISLSNSAVIKVSVVHGTLQHWLFVRYKNDNVYIFTNKADTSISAQRYIVRFQADLFPHDYYQDTDFYDEGSTDLETSDITVNDDGVTKSKHYQGLNYGRTMDYDYVGKQVEGGVGMWMIRSNHEKASGGPFFRSLLRRGSPTGEDLYDIYWYNMGHTDVQRFGLQGPSVLSFTDGGDLPSSSLFARNADWSWFDDLGIDGWVPESGRGYALGVGLSNMKSGYTYTIGLSNDDAQYWADAGTSSGSGSWSIYKILPGTYTLTVYKEELEVATTSVTITAGSGTAVHTLTCDDPSDTSAIWRIGDWDGTPYGFLNFEEKPFMTTYMHPSDSRISTWDAGNFIVGTSADSSFPGYMWQDINNDHIIYFRLSEAQYAEAHTVRIGITEAYINGRPMITVNDWTSSIPSASSQASTRSLTVGTYRGNNVVFEYTVPASAWTQSTSEWQRLTITIVTGSTGSGGYLSGGVSFDCLEMI